MSGDAFLQYELDDGSGTVARWHGGEYIELGYVAEQETGPYNDRGQPSYEKGDFVAGEVINVWDHAKGEARIPFALDALRETVDDWLSGHDDDDDDEGSEA